MITPADLLQARYGSEESTRSAIAWNSCLTTLLSHRSIRSYLPTPLPAGTLEILVAAAQSAATSSNLQTWSLVAIEDPERKARLADLAGGQAHIRQCPLFLVWLADLSRLARIAESQGLPHSGLDYTEMFIVAAIDAALAAQNAVVAAESLGLGTVYIGAMRNHPEAVAAELRLPERTFAVFGLCVGYPTPQNGAQIKPRLPQATVLHRETYATAAEPIAVSDYDQTMQNFYKQQHMGVQGNWSQHSIKRVEGASALTGRDRLREALKNRGFHLF